MPTRQPKKRKAVTKAIVNAMQNPQQLSFGLLPHVFEHIQIYAAALAHNNHVQGLQDYHAQRMELRRQDRLTYAKWYYSRTVTKYRERLGERMDAKSLPYYRHLEQLYEEYCMAFKNLHRIRRGRVYPRPPNKGTYAWALGQAVQHYALAAQLPVPPLLPDKGVVQDDVYYRRLAEPDMQLARLKALNLLPLFGGHSACTQP